MNWLCWHVGTVTDPKFGRIAADCRTPLPNVIALWAMILESARDGRGAYSLVPGDAAFALGIGEQTIIDIHERMIQRGLVDGFTVQKWTERQGQSNAERAREWRERRKANPEQAERSRTSPNVAERSQTIQTDTHTDTHTDIHTDKDTTSHYASDGGLAERVEAALYQDLPVFGLTAACDMLTGEGFTEGELIEAARSIAARGKRRVSANYFIQAARGMKDDANRPVAPRKPRYNPADASSPDAVAERRAALARGFSAAFPDRRTDHGNTEGETP